ncbi:sensor histidine kinase [Tsuneonella rigui]|uniref:sensor histidine kinase n=1 Tax=Tsuneonella rigui TaxID=1708790 RepID=UPI002407B830|nr:histidine kinase dimerization/phosphoacceptor domain -containing protein [Tsuneonella rigui]
MLYVDDDDALRRLTQRALGRRGFEVEVAESADTGLARLRDEQFDLVAIDHYMPGKSGLDLLAEIVALEEHPPVVFVTGNDDTAVAVKALHAGALDFVVKTVGDTFFDVLDGRFRQALSRDKLERDKRAAEAELRLANERLELLVREVHHRVSNSLQMVLSFVAMQAKQSDAPEVRAALDDIQNRIKAISKVHQRLYTRDDLTTIDLDAYLGNLVEDLRESLPEAVTIELASEAVMVSPDTAVSVGVIVNELVSNAAKYAFGPGQRGQITVRLESEPAGGFAVTVEDNGSGFDTEDAPVGTGLGTRIVDAIARSLGTKVQVMDKAGGTALRLSVKSGR